MVTLHAKFDPRRFPLPEGRSPCRDVPSHRVPAGRVQRPCVVPCLFPGQGCPGALAQYDTDRDGFLNGEELNQCPALKNSLAALDSDKDGRLSAAEIANRLRTMQEQGIGQMSVNCRVTLDDAPLVGATVTLLPEKFLGSGYKTACGQTDSRGLRSSNSKARHRPVFRPVSIGSK